VFWFLYISKGRKGQRSKGQETELRLEGVNNEHCTGGARIAAVGKVDVINNYLQFRKMNSKS